MGVNRIIFWKIVDVKIWFDCNSYEPWLCEEKEKEIEEMVVWNENENEMIPNRTKMKRKEKREIEGP